MKQLNPAQHFDQLLRPTLVDLSDIHVRLTSLCNYMRQEEIGKWKLLYFGEPVELEKLELRINSIRKAIGRTIANGGIIMKVKKQLSGMNSVAHLLPLTYFYDSATDIQCLCHTKEGTPPSDPKESSLRPTLTLTNGTPSETTNSDEHLNDASQSDIDLED